MNRLIEKLKLVKDFRRNSGKRHPLWLILSIVILGTMQGYLGYRALGSFAKSNQKELSKTFGIVTSLLPSYSCIRRVMSGVDYQNLLQIFNDWAAEEYQKIADDPWVAVDGKILKNTLINPHDKSQNFIKFVSLFSQKTGLVLHIKQLENKKGSEIASVQDIIKDCQLKNKVFTGDSLQCQKETIRCLVESNNDYVIAVKKNQPNLYNHLEKISRDQSKILSNVVEKDLSHGRKIEREVSVFEFTENQKKEWESVKNVIQVTRSGERGKKPYKEIVYYISNTTKDAQTYAKIIRGHWTIENQLHWVKDVILEEDKSLIKEFNAATNLSILKTIVINLFRSLGFISITEGQRWLAHRWSKLLILTT